MKTHLQALRDCVTEDNAYTDLFLKTINETCYAILKDTEDMVTWNDLRKHLGVKE